MNFVGSKGGAGVAEWIVSQMPPHSVYVEAFLGTGAVMRLKRPAARNIGIEADPQVIADYWAGVIDANDSPVPIDGNDRGGLRIVQGDAFEFLPKLTAPPDALVYADPPYLASVRSQAGRVYYGRELLTESEHVALLTLLRGLPCQVMLSGYWSQLYATMLPGWRTSSKWTSNRGGKRVQEWLWMNFPEPARLHDPRFVGADFTDRQRIKRKVARWRKRFASMRPGERAAVWEAISSSMAGSDWGGLDRRECLGDQVQRLISVRVIAAG